MAKKIHSYEISKADLKVAKNQLNDHPKISYNTIDTKFIIFILYYP